MLENEKFIYIYDSSSWKKVDITYTYERLQSWQWHSSITIFIRFNQSISLITLFNITVRTMCICVASFTSSNWDNMENVQGLSFITYNLVIKNNVLAHLYKHTLYDKASSLQQKRQMNNYLHFCTAVCIRIWGKKHKRQISSFAFRFHKTKGVMQT